ncbi:hypothetical protein MFIFM68171_09712 [Madurella fahalii]|uniref:Myb-like DNA-binding domain-containing protein n=1 Tax=Madurella fahalii TaxID=1157608 RepID=A0ABQ0GP36_9PEZI
MSIHDSPMARFLLAIIVQMDPKDVKWEDVARSPILDEKITSGHAARMRYSRFRKAILRIPTKPRRKRKNISATPGVPAKQAPSTERKPASYAANESQAEPQDHGTSSRKRTAETAEPRFPSLDFSSTQKERLGNQEGESTSFYLLNRMAVLILPPWGSLAPVGLEGTLVDTGIFNEGQDMPEPPKCYTYDRVDGRIIRVKGWASGYEDGGPFVRQREIPVLCVDNADFHLWSLGWAWASDLSPLNFHDPGSEIPLFDAARDYYLYRVRGYGLERRQGENPTQTPTMSGLLQQQQPADTEDAFRPLPSREL